MTDALFIEKSWRSPSSSRFWVLLVLAAVIATAGVIGDSTATVIGAMIVAPLMTPILGSALALVLADHRHLQRSILLVLGGAVAVVAVGYLFAVVAAPPDHFASNSQVAGRISPRLIDLVGALATGTVGAFALIRSDISDTLPGVAIAISLVPPLAVTGLLLQVGRYHDAGESALLFATNVAAIVATGTVVFLVYRVRDAARQAGLPLGRLTGRTLAVVAAAVLLVAVPLTTGTVTVSQDLSTAADATPVAKQWAAQGRWQVADVQSRSGTIVVTVLGIPPTPASSQLRTALNSAGLAAHPLQIHLVGGNTRTCPAHGDTCTTSTGGSN
ncbi:MULTISPECIES: DUF389 domain-containing protein [Streptacidiphilus]|uniref:DUF389 domain-containing protein n=2 Tax=Streptacidiphilus TaxID=228398 RepID=A0ABV6XW86_9ACTN|nr:DUF389 domain-containing protein [Streptacidiphilus jeojiense]